MAAGFTITREMVAEWKATVADLQRKIEAAEVFFPDIAIELPGSDADGPKNFMGTIARMANDAKKPITKADLKSMLKEAGFPDEQVGSTYFYLAIRKLKDAERITVDEDGSIWRGTRD